MFKCNKSTGWIGHPSHRAGLGTFAVPHHECTYQDRRGLRYYAVRRYAAYSRVINGVRQNWPAIVVWWMQPLQHMSLGGRHVYVSTRPRSFVEEGDVPEEIAEAMGDKLVRFIRSRPRVQWIGGPTAQEYVSRVQEYVSRVQWIADGEPQVDNG